MLRLTTTQWGTCHRDTQYMNRESQQPHAHTQRHLVKHDQIAIFLKADFTLSQELKRALNADLKTRVDYRILRLLASIKSELQLRVENK